MAHAGHLTPPFPPPQPPRSSCSLLQESQAEESRVGSVFYGLEEGKLTQMFEHVVNSVYIPADDVISQRLHECGGPSSAALRLQICGWKVLEGAGRGWESGALRSHHSLNNTAVACWRRQSYSSTFSGCCLLVTCQLRSCLPDFLRKIRLVSFLESRYSSRLNQKLFF